MDLRRIMQRRALLQQPPPDPPDFYTARHTVLRLDAMDLADPSSFRVGDPRDRYKWRMAAPKKPEVKMKTMGELKKSVRGKQISLSFKGSSMKSFSLS